MDNFNGAAEVSVNFADERIAVCPSAHWVVARAVMMAITKWIWHGLRERSRSDSFVENFWRRLSMRRWRWILELSLRLSTYEFADVAEG